MTDTRTPAELQAANLAHFMERGPGLSYGYRTWVEAKDTKNKRVRLGGLGGMGVGSMWFEETDAHKEYPGYAEAKDVDSKKPLNVSIAWAPNIEHPERVAVIRTGGDAMDHWSWAPHCIYLPINLLHTLAAFVWGRMTEEERAAASAHEWSVEQREAVPE